jgi:hypothetical protein
MHRHAEDWHRWARADAPARSPIGQKRTRGTDRIFGPYALQNEYRNFNLLGRYLRRSSRRDRGEALTDYLVAWIPV